MAICYFCKQSFTRLSDTEMPCGRCSQRQPGLSSAKLRTLNSTPQCAGCGVVSRSLRLALCNKCIDYYREGPNVPREVLKLKGIPELLVSHTISRKTEEVIKSALIHHASTSSARLNLPQSGVISRPSTSQTLSRLGLNVTSRILAEKGVRRRDTELRSTRDALQIAVSLWRETVVIGRMQQVHAVRVLRVFPLSDNLRDALNDLLSRVKNCLAKWDSLTANDMSWQNIVVYAHENASKAVAIELEWDKPVQYLFDELKAQRIGPVKTLAEHSTELRFVYMGSIDDTPTPESTSLTSIKLNAGKRKRTDSATSVISSFPASRSHQKAPQIQSHTILRSAFLPPPVPRALRSLAPPAVAESWSRKPLMKSYQFTRIIAHLQESGAIHLTRNVDKELMIHIAVDWMEGEAKLKQGEPYDQTGFIGSGSSKCGIYARFEGREYVLTQPMEWSLGSDEVEEVLGAEYKLLFQCDRFKTEFDNFARNQGVSGIPTEIGFYFNFKDSVFGQLHSTKSSNSHIIPHKIFLATPLLPCSQTDTQIQKFTGNDILGTDGLDDKLTAVIHAFTHFSLIYSHDYMTVCDLQGMPDREGIMCLIDPQAHSRAPALGRVYWDQGEIVLKRLKEEHARVCSKNTYCNKLGPRHVLVKGCSPIKPSTRHCVDFLLNDSD